MFGLTNSLLIIIIPLNKFEYKNVIIQKDENLYYICYIVGIIVKDTYSLLQYKSAKYIL